MEHADRFLRRFYIEKGMFGSLSLTFIFYRPPLIESPFPGANGPFENAPGLLPTTPDRGGRPRGEMSLV